MNLGYVSDKGKTRSNNEDNFFIYDDYPFPFFVIADGVGGHKAGELASKMAVDTIADVLKNKNDAVCIDDVEDAIRTSIVSANNSIYKYSKFNKECEGMGTTVLVCAYYKNTCLIAHVGDSRAYLIREHEIAQLTEDHTFGNELIKRAGSKIFNVKNIDNKNALTRALGTEKTVVIDTYKFIHRSDDIVLLCTDGLNKEVEDNSILAIVEKYKSDSMQKVAEELKDRAILMGGRDNVTIITIKA
ncbi:Stp1/IreP family PP2C-type Ser/Thr phosphatase [Fenollaria massiliensis]|uniref:Stp1/IreP family PP2C-type Ser/Thr phosphatase n=1 Tax=Fenollaria massiliensis TaxID=938288 RepID=UPI0003756190|nr:Stp1/IreP family PP2C-type Ser/Thr phosphatase [Fenollaria massiliensis]